MSKRNRTQGAGTSVPAPRGVHEDQAAIVAELRAATREAREALSDLHQERKAVEKLALNKAEDFLAAHTNGWMDELQKHMAQQMQASSADIVKYFQDLLSHYMGKRQGPPPAPPELPEILSAVDVLNRALSAGKMELPKEWTGG